MCSTLAAETLALLDCAEAAVYMRQVISDISGFEDIPIKCFVDNKSLLDALNSGKGVADKRLRIDLAVLSNMLQTRVISDVSWVDTAHQLANCLTKRGASSYQLRASISRD